MYRSGLRTARMLPGARRTIANKRGCRRVGAHEGDACLRSKSMKGWAMREKDMPPTNGRSSSTGARHTRRMVLICTVRMRTAITGVMFTAGSTFSLPVRTT